LKLRVKLRCDEDLWGKKWDLWMESREFCGMDSRGDFAMGVGD
jgi:hypothetical protein